MDENTLKKKIYNMAMPENIPPLNIILKDFKLTLKEFVEGKLNLDSKQLVP